MKNYKTKKSQSALEFIILVAVVLFLFISFTFAFQQNIRLKADEKRRLEVQEIAIQIKKEIELAAFSSDGYERSFKVPERIINIDYAVSITDGFVYVKTNDDKHALALPVPNVTGQIQKGTNIIRKDNGIVYLNE